ncbi:MAG: hypothetical protein JOY67_16760 [Hyphomicrobiales bacterium]|nr:hypothetical protein [Hyphomicrobiales bacterium]
MSWAFSLRGPRGSTVIADAPDIIHELTLVDLERIEAELPNLAIAFHKMVARTDAERVQFAIRTLEAVY